MHSRSGFGRPTLNPMSARLSRSWWHSAVRRAWRNVRTFDRPIDAEVLKVRQVAAGALLCDMSNRFSAVSPGPWVVPKGMLPAWNWLPDGFGAQYVPGQVPPWSRIWFRTPFVDRYAYAWFWRRGGFLVVANDSNQDGLAGVREPRRPRPPGPLVDSAVIDNGR